MSGEPAGDDRIRFGHGLIRDVFAVLDAHGYRRGDDSAVGRAIGTLVQLVGEYEDMSEPEAASPAPAEPRLVGSIVTVLRAGDPEPDDGTLLLWDDGTARRYRRQYRRGTWADYVTAKGPFVVVPSYDTVLTAGQGGA